MSDNPDDKTTMKKETDPLLTAVAEVVVDPESNEKKPEAIEDIPYGKRLWEVMAATASLGFTAFGDSNAQVSIIQDEICVQREWMDQETFMELFALSRAIPGPLATQLLMASSIVRAGALGGLFSLILWVLPGACILTGAGMLVEALGWGDEVPLWLRGVAPATVALVFKAAYSFGKSLDNFGFALAIMSCTAAVLINGDLSISPTDSQFAYPVMLACGGILSFVDAMQRCRPPIGTYAPGSSNVDQKIINRIGIPVWAGAFLIQTWLMVLLGTILVVSVVDEVKDNACLQLFEAFFRIGSIVFGGGEDVLAMLEAEMVPDWVSSEQFFQGLGLAQALPGPLFNLSAFIGAVKYDIPGAAVSVLGVFAPSYLFMLAGISFWARLHKLYWFKAILKGVNAVAIGFIGAACIFLWESAIKHAADAMIFVVAGGLATYYNLPAPIVIVVSIVMGMFLYAEKINLGQVPYN